MQKKVKIIDAICERHPSYGVEKGWGEYTGGMKDSGQWFFRKMLNINLKELQLFLANIILEESKPKYELTEQEKSDSMVWQQIGIKGGVFINNYTIKKENQLQSAINRKLLFGE